MGEISIDGRVKPVGGALSVAVCARGLNKRLILPFDNQREAAVVEGAVVYGVKTLSELVEFINGNIKLEPYLPGLNAEPQAVFIQTCRMSGDRNM